MIGARAMKRLIYLEDAIDALEREKTYSTAYKDGYAQTDYFKQYNMGLTDGIKALNKLPSAHPEIIRCKDCKYRLNHYCHHEDTYNLYVHMDGYCSRGERRNEAR